MNRRQFLARSAAGAAAALARPAFAQTSSSIELRIRPDQILGQTPPDFVGLGYEISSVGQEGLLSPANRRMIQFIRTLSPRGNIRIGGDTSDWAHWAGSGRAVSSPRGTVVDQKVIADLGGLLHELGWSLIWGLNLGSGTIEEAVNESAAVASSAGPALLALEIGNEPDLFAPNHRKKGYDYPQFLGEYRRFKQAIRAKLPGVPFAGPDAASRTDWVERFAADEAKDLRLLTRHHYSQGPPENPRTTIEDLLAPRPSFVSMLHRIQKASAACGVPYRFCEVNSCFHGGKPRVSDTFASALWVLDLMHTLAAHDCCGINIETGVNQLNFVSHYSPIYPIENGGYVARPIYYGMLAFSLASRGKRIPVEFDAGPINLRAYASIGEDRRIRLTLINKELNKDVTVRFQSVNGSDKATVQRLAAPRIDSKEGVTLAGASVDQDGRWSPHPGQQVKLREGAFEIHLPRHTAAIVEL